MNNQNIYDDLWEAEQIDTLLPQISSVEEKIYWQEQKDQQQLAQIRQTIAAIESSS